MDRTIMTKVIKGSFHLVTKKFKFHAIAWVPKIPKIPKIFYAP